MADTPPAWVAERFSHVMRDLRALHAALRERALTAGMIADSDREHLWERHIADSLSAAEVLEDEALAYDLGSGAGLPGLPLAIALPETRFVLIESRSKRAGFLELAAEQLGLATVRVLVARVEEVGERVRSGAEDATPIATARAFAPLPRCWALAEPLLAPAGRLVYFAGGSFDERTVGATDPPARLVSVLEVVDSPARLAIMARQ